MTFNQFTDFVPFDSDDEPGETVRTIPANGSATPYPVEEPVQLKALSASYERKFNLGNFNSLTVAITIWARTRVPEGHAFDLHDAKRRLRGMARTNVRAQLQQEQTRRQQRPANPLFLGLEPPAVGGLDPIYVRTVGVSLSRKLNLGNYDNIMPAYSDWADLRHLADSQAALHLALSRMWASLWVNIEDELARAQGVPTGATDFGLPTLTVATTPAPTTAPSRLIAATNGSRPSSNGYANGQSQGGH